MGGRRQRKTGRGLINTAINKLPIELHIPGYNYCGPGTKLQKRLQRGDRGINPLDDACKEHDIAYEKYPDNISERHRADKILGKRAWERVTAKDSKIGEKLAALGVAGTMKAKVKLGMGVKKRVSKDTNTLKKVISKVGRAVKGLKKNSNLLKAAKFAHKLAVDSVQNRGISGLKTKTRFIPIPKTGGALPLIPIFAALSAIGSLAGGASGIAKAVNDAKNARKQLAEMQRHNKMTEAIALQKGKGLYLAPYKKSGMGLFLKNDSKKKNDEFTKSSSY